MKKRKIALLIAGMLIILGTGVYWKLGGFNQVSLSVKDQGDVRLLGITYRGTPQDPAMAEAFREIEKVINDYPQSKLHTIYYVEPAGKTDTLQVFVGLEYPGTIADESNLEIKEIACEKAIVAKIRAHKSVMPSPQSVKQQIEDFAKEKGLVLQGIFVDKIISNNQVDVIAPLKI